MKKLSFYLFILSGFLTLSTSCSADDQGSSVSVQPVINAASSGTWKITYYVDSDSEETGQFSSYTFTFGSNTITATNGTNTYTGTWSVTNSNSSDDDSNDNEDIDFNIGFASPANFAELSDDWHIISYSDTKIQLIDVSGGNGGTDYLTFEKI